ncbi:MAG: NADP-specific glutamate dehydrogenase [Balneolia bacterium]|nr:NADP-specific glutamate dehydrogenase [Balneolia bacterium]
MKSEKELTLDAVLEIIKKRDPDQKEFLQAAKEVLQWIIPFAKSSDKYNSYALFERLIEPERIIQFRVPWVTDDGVSMTNRGYRIQFNSALGPYKGGLRFHPEVNLSILKFLAFEQTFKNSLTGLPLGGGKGGSDFNPKGRSDSEIMRFCQSFMTELYRHIGPDTDIPAGDIGVGAAEIGYLFGQYKRLTSSFNGVLTGKGLSFGGSQLRPEATGYGLLYFVEEMMNTAGDEIKDAAVIISGSGNVAQYSCQKAIELGMKVLTMSDSDGYIVVKDGITEEQLEQIMELKNENKGRIKECTDLFECEFHEGTPWSVEAEVALPCATQNELDEDHAKTLVENGLKYLAEGANMPCTDKAVAYFMENDIRFVPGKASNAGGVSVSGLEMTQNAMRLSWDSDRVDDELRQIMHRIHEQCTTYGKSDDGDDDVINYEKGAAIAGFIKVADAMIAQGSV